MMQISNLRKADGRLGDDTTYTRWIRVNRHGQKAGTRAPALMPASATTTKFPTRRLRPNQMRGLLVSGHSNVKIGRDLRVGKLKGYWLFTLSLPERETCPASCLHWRDCYGNNMPFAKRIIPDATFLPALEANIKQLLRTRGRRGIIVRLHALGDFYSVEYVAFWERMLREHPRLVIFGYTAYLLDAQVAAERRIAEAVNRLIDTFPGRAMMRFSNGRLGTRSAISVKTFADTPVGAFACPDQTGQFDGCGKCGACIYTLKDVAFADHEAG